MLAVASHHSLNYQICEETTRGIGGITQPNYHLFSITHTPAVLHANDNITNTNWLKMVCLAHAAYEEPDSDIISQAISQRNQMHSYLLTNGPLIPVLAHKNPIATYNNNLKRISTSLNCTTF